MTASEAPHSAGPSPRPGRMGPALARSAEALGKMLAPLVPRPRPKLMRQHELVERVKGYDPGADEALLNRAYVYAMRAHGKQFRASGDPYFSHPLEVAAILTELKLDVPTTPPP